ncbi:MAG: fibronectin type III domain-containing protein [Chloroflexi bacterium]|nr:fibronectin type III domain-containing protein [Chloroflexota bacterium]
MFGGSVVDLGSANDLWEYTDTNGWRRLTAQDASGTPPRRSRQTAVWDPPANRLLVFGGRAPDARLYNDLWQYTDAGGWSQITPPTGVGWITAREGHAATWDTQANRLLVFGGYGTSTRRNDLWQYAPTAPASSVGWSELSAAAAAGVPNGRTEHTVVWDGQANRLLLFGGWPVDSPGGNDLWQYTATGGWRLLTANGAPGAPAAGGGHAAAWDSRNNRLLVVGGCCDSGGRSFGDLWQYTDAGGWKALSSPTTLTPRKGASAVWDAQNNRLLLFGGSSTSATNELWQYTDARGWELVLPSGPYGLPVGRYNHTAVWDSQAQRMLVFGGRTSSLADRNDLWEYTAASGWRPLTAQGAAGTPLPRLFHTAVWDSQSNRLLVFGGSAYQMGANNELWQYSSTGGWKLLLANDWTSPIGRRYYHAAAWDTQANRLLVSSGLVYDESGKGVRPGDLWQYGTLPTGAPPGAPTGVRASASDGNVTVTWAVPVSDGGSPITGYTVSSSAGQTVTWGGGPLSATFTGLTNGQTYTFHVTASNAIGSGTASAPSNEVVPRSLPPTVWTELTGNGASGSPLGRHNHAAAWDSQNNRLLVFGGSLDYGAYKRNDLWEYTRARRWRQLTANGAPGAPANKFAPVAAWDTQANRLLVFGGWDESSARNDLWQYTDAGGWQLLVANGTLGAPRPRSMHAATWDAQHNRLLVFSGSVQGDGDQQSLNFRLNDLWQYTSAGGWQELSPNGALGAPIGRHNHTITWDAESGRLLLFGGTIEITGPVNDLWQWTDAGGWQQLAAANAPGGPRPRSWINSTSN